MTDAHYLLGRIDPERFAAGALDLDESAIEDAFDARLGEPLGRSVEEAARGVVEVANASMERALRVVSVERGHDPRSFALVAYGGAGPLHAAELADALDVPRVLVPRAAGALSALGLLVGDVVSDLSATRVRPWSEVDPAALEARFAEFEAEGRERLDDEGVPPSDRRYERAVDVRYAGQAYELTVPMDGEVDEASLDSVVERFHDAHEERYGHADPGEPVELVTFRLRARGLVDPPPLSPPASADSVEAARMERRPVDFGDGPRPSPVYERDGLPAGEGFEGPAIVEGAEATIVVPPDVRARVDDRGTVVLEVA